MTGVDWEAVVCGAGVVGAAVAEALARRLGGSVLLLDREERAGAGTTSRNSGVVHAGLYHPTGWLKQRTCVEGRRRLYRFCEAHGVAHRRCGKLVVAQDPEEAERLDSLRERAERNGVEGLRLLSGEEARRLEPEVRAHAALLSPESGIVDPHELTDVLIGLAEERGTDVILGAELIGLEGAGPPWTLLARTPHEEATRIRANLVVNAGGLFADQVAERLGVAVEERGLRQRFAVGRWLRLPPRWSGRVSRLIYPLPAKDLAGLGIHLTLELDGSLKLGPDLEWVDGPEPDLGPGAPDRATRFFEAARRYLPGLEDASSLRFDQAGVRPKLSRRGEPARDFELLCEPERPGMVQMLGIESPGLTAALALAEEVAERLLG